MPKINNSQHLFLLKQAKKRAETLISQWENSQAIALLHQTIRNHYLATQRDSNLQRNQFLFREIRRLEQELINLKPDYVKNAERDLLKITEDYERLVSEAHGR